MKKAMLLSVLVFCLVILLAMMRIAKKKQPAGNSSGFAVVELFTSEGCSSCPPADKVVAGLLDKYKNNVYVLGFHVDYWNYLGWKDAYSSSAFSQRQQQYGSRFHLNSVYTPQVIVNGATEFVGSDAGKLQSSVEDGLNTPAVLPITISAKNDAGSAVTISYQFQSQPAGLLNIALIQLHAQSNVQRGENTGKLLQHVNVVRDFKTIPAKLQGEIGLTLPGGVKVEDCEIIAYLQNPGTFKITAAATAGITPH